MRQFPLRRPWYHSLRISFLILSLLAVHLVGLILFFNGFLLSRTSLNQFSTSDNAIVAFDGAAPFVGRTPQRAFDRALIMVVDALRLDFVKAQQYSNADSVFVEIMPGIQDLVTHLVRCLSQSKMQNMQSL